jgi:hypothetical protein
VADVVRQMGRDVLDCTYNAAEPQVEDCPPRLRFGEELYRRRVKTPHTLGTLFGSVVVTRCV